MCAYGAAGALASGRHGRPSACGNRSPVANGPSEGRALSRSAPQRARRVLRQLSPQYTRCCPPPRFRAPGCTPPGPAPGGQQSSPGRVPGMPKPRCGASESMGRRRRGPRPSKAAGSPRRTGPHDGEAPRRPAISLTAAPRWPPSPQAAAQAAAGSGPRAAANRRRVAPAQHGTGRGGP